MLSKQGQICAGQRQVWGAIPSKIDQGTNEPTGEIWATGRILPYNAGVFLSQKTGK